MSRQRGGAADRAPDDPRYRFLARFGSVILSGGIAAVPRALYYYQAELGLLPQEVWFVGYILAHRWTAELPYPSLRKMARRTGVTYQMLHRYKNSLIAKEYLQILPRTRQNGGRTTNSYDFSGLFQAIESLLLRDRGEMDEALDEPEPEPDEPRTPGQPGLIDPDHPRLPRSGKPRLTAPDQPQRMARIDPDPIQEPSRRKGSRSVATTISTGGTVAPSDALDAILALYTAANERPASPLQARGLADLAGELDDRLGPGRGAEWVAAAIREAADAGSRYLSPRLLRRICERWLREGRPGEAAQSLNTTRTENVDGREDWTPLPAEMWKAVVERLAAALSPANFQAFVAPVRPVGVRGDRACLAVPDDLTAQRLTGSFRSLVEAALAAATGRRVTVECRVGRPGAPAGGEGRRA